MKPTKPIKKSYQQLKFYDSGYEQGQSDLKARLISNKVIKAVCDAYDCEDRIEDLDFEEVIELALAEATKEGGGK